MYRISLHAVKPLRRLSPFCVFGAGFEPTRCTASLQKRLIPLYWRIDTSPIESYSSVYIPPPEHLPVFPGCQHLPFGLRRLHVRLVG